MLVPAPPGMALGMAGVPEDALLELDVHLEDVSDGVLATVTAEVPVRAECARCLDPLHSTLALHARELFVREVDEQTDPDAPTVHEEHVDLEPLLRDAVVLALPPVPLCHPDCPGLCARCGVRMAEDPEHTHEDHDPRWDALAALLTQPVTSDEVESKPSEPAELPPAEQKE